MSLYLSITGTKIGTSLNHFRKAKSRSKIISYFLSHVLLIIKLELRKIEEEKNQALEDLENVEAAFGDVHRKYERTKQVHR